MASTSGNGTSGSGNGGSGGSMSAEDKMRSEIARLTATIEQHKSGSLNANNKPSSYGYGNSYTSAYGGSGYRGRGRGRGGMVAGPHKQYVRPGLVTSSSAGAGAVVVGKGKENAVTSGPAAGVAGGVDGGVSGEGGGAGEVVPVGGRKEVVIGGVAFEASKRSLVRKDLAKPKLKTEKTGTTTAPGSGGAFMRKGFRGHLMASSRIYKPKGGRRPGRNMTLDNTSRTYTQSKKAAIRKIDKPCSRFTKTGTCSRGLTCPYQHDPNKIAICWNFMQGDCPKSADTCNLSHNPTPERTPLCVHFLNRGRCTKEKCLFPHVNVGKKDGVCKDFAVLGYCEKGIECDKNHVRECPEFEETGECRTKGCKLPHVIKANARWAKKESGKADEGITDDVKMAGADGGGGGDGDVSAEKVLTVENARLGDEYISLIFNESASESDSEGEEEGEDTEEGQGEGEEGEDEGEGEEEGSGGESPGEMKEDE